MFQIIFFAAFGLLSFVLSRFYSGKILVQYSLLGIVCLCLSIWSYFAKYYLHLAGSTLVINDIAIMIAGIILAVIFIVLAVQYIRIK